MACVTGSGTDCIVPCARAETTQTRSTSISFVLDVACAPILFESASSNSNALCLGKQPVSKVRWASQHEHNLQPS